MELLKPKDNLTFSIGDVKFFIRPQMTVRDKLELDMLGDYDNGVFQVKKGDIIAKLVELFVVGWDGVTEDGKPVPYSYRTFAERLPADMARDWMLNLGTFIFEQLGLGKTEQGAVKNGSPAQ